MIDEEIKRLVGEIDLFRLQKKMTREGYGPVPVALGDLFAAGCYFIKQGNKVVGEKFCYTALAAYEIDHAVIRRVVAHIEGAEQEMATLLNPHFEVPHYLFENDRK